MGGRVRNSAETDSFPDGQTGASNSDIRLPPGSSPAGHTPQAAAWQIVTEVRRGFFPFRRTAVRNTTRAGGDEDRRPQDPERLRPVRYRVRGGPSSGGRAAGFPCGYMSGHRYGFGGTPEEWVGLVTIGREMVREGGIEPPRAFAHKILSLARLPVSPLPRCALRKYSYHNAGSVVYGRIERGGVTLAIGRMALWPAHRWRTIDRGSARRGLNREAPPRRNRARHARAD